MSLGGVLHVQMSKRVGIVGAGVAGLAAIKCSLEDGMVPVCFEQASDIGGLWNYRSAPPSVSL